MLTAVFIDVKALEKKIKKLNVKNVKNMEKLKKRLKCDFKKRSPSVSVNNATLCILHSYYMCFL